MEKIFMFNSPPRSGNVFLTYLFSMFVDEPVNKCLEIKRYSDKTEKQAAFFRNPYDSIPSMIIKSRVEWGGPVGVDNIGDLQNSISIFAKEYLEAIKEAKANASNIYIGKSEDMMNDPIGTIADIALFFDFEVHNKQISNNNQIVEEIKNKMLNTERARVDKDGITIVENLMTSHDGHLPREKTEQRVFLDELIKKLNLDIVTQCYEEYLSIESTNAKKGQRWKS
jgi:hypothetical protein